MPSKMVNGLRVTSPTQLCPASSLTLAAQLLAGNVSCQFLLSSSRHCITDATRSKSAQHKLLFIGAVLRPDADLALF
jgi:hypothetical protein